jgi:hypothetical protein
MLTRTSTSKEIQEYYVKFEKLMFKIVDEETDKLRNNLIKENH